MAELLFRRALFLRGLFLLELRRGLRGGLALGGVLLAVLLASADWMPAALELEAGDQSALARGLVRQGTWSGALLLLLPAFVLHAAGTFARWRGGDADWLACRPTRRSAALSSTWCGATAAAVIALAAVAVVVELGASGGGATFAAAGTHDLSRYARVEPGEVIEVGLGSFAHDAPGGSRLRVLVVATVGAGPTTEVEIAAGRGGVQRLARERVTARTRVELELPPGDGDLSVRIANVGGGAAAVVAPGSFELWVPAGTERSASVAVVVRAAAGLAALIALAIGFGAWVGTVTAACAAGALWWLGAAWLGEGWPGGGLGRTLGIIGQGRLPGDLDPLALVAGASLVILGLATALAGMRSWRFGP